MPRSFTFLLSLAKYLQIIVLVGLILYVGSTLFVPLFYGLFIAIILYPICKWLEMKKWPRPLAISLTMLILLVLGGLLIWILVLEVGAFKQTIPSLNSKIETLFFELRQWLVINWKITLDMQNDWFENLINNLERNIGELVRGTISLTLEMIFALFITPVFTVLFLYNRRSFVRVLELLTRDSFHEKLHIILEKTIKTYFNYVKGMLAVYLIVGILNSIGLLLLGIENAILFGMLTAIMTIIPYVGIIVSALLPISVAWLTTDSFWYPVGVIAIFGFVQYLEANLIFPMVVGAQLQINTWASIIAIIAGGIIWGGAGMIISLPILAILKLLSDDIEEWKPFNVLISM